MKGKDGSIRDRKKLSLSSAWFGDGAGVDREYCSASVAKLEVVLAGVTRAAFEEDVDNEMPFPCRD